MPLYRISTPVLALMADAAYQHDIAPAWIFAALSDDDFENHLSQHHAKWLTAAITNHPNIYQHRKARAALEEWDFAGGDPRGWHDKLGDGLNPDHLNALTLDKEKRPIMAVKDIALARFDLKDEGDIGYSVDLQPTQLIDDDGWVWEGSLLEIIEEGKDWQAINYEILRYPTTI